MVASLALLASCAGPPAAPAGAVPAPPPSVFSHIEIGGGYDNEHYPTRTR